MRIRILFPLVALAALLTPAAASADFPHVVTAGESLYSVAGADGLNVAQLAADNGLSPGAQLVAGSTLMIPPRGSPGSSGSGSTSVSGGAGSGEPSGDDSSGVSSGTTETATSPGAQGGRYVVQPGDTLSGIAANAGLSVSELASANGLDPNGVIRAGSVLGLGSGAGTSGATSSSAGSQPVGSAAAGSVSDPPYPTAERVTASEVGSIASDNGVAPSLAQAIGWQESGFNNDLVSSSDARGVMQILPGTWNWIQRTLTAGTQLAPASAHDNVRGGVLLLHSLLGATGGDPALAAAGYYQGLPSVRRNGLFTDTERYVNSVMALRQHFGGG